MRTVTVPSGFSSKVCTTTSYNALSRPPLGDPAILVGTVLFVVEVQSQGIEEHRRSLYEADLMLPQILLRLGGVPLEIEPGRIHLQRAYARLEVDARPNE